MDIVHHIVIAEQLSLFPEYPSEISISCSCDYVHVTTDEALHETALQEHIRQALTKGEQVANGTSA